jgi:hypothetical protein
MTTVYSLQTIFLSQMTFYWKHITQIVYDELGRNNEVVAMLETD